jgi:hypothetical protein
VSRKLLEDPVSFFTGEACDQACFDRGEASTEHASPSPIKPLGSPAERKQQSQNYLASKVSEGDQQLWPLVHACE